MSETIPPNGREPIKQPDSIEDTNLEPELISELLFRSFYYSQGIPPAQAHIIAYIAKKHPDWKISESTKEKALLLTEERNAVFVLKGPHKIQSEERIKRESQIRLDVLCDALNRGFIQMTGKDVGEDEKGVLEVPVENFSTGPILANMITRDMKYATAGGRPNREDVSTKHFRPHISHVIDYVLLGKKAPGPPIFGEMMRELQQILKDPEPYLGPETEGLRKNIHTLLAYHNQHNPQEPVDLSGYPNLI